MKKLLSVFAAFTTLLSAHAEGNFVVHEWGTFTSLQGSNGKEIEGMHHEEEALPPFVNGRAKRFGFLDGPGFCKTLICPGDPRSGARGEQIPSGVTQKMETPVIYFYSDKERELKVTVDFPGGILSQYYPSPSFERPQIGQLRELKEGQNVYQLKVLQETVDVPAVGELGKIYLPSRQVDANYVENHLGERDRLVFYRGLGDFSLPVSITSDGKEILRIRNKGPDAIRQAFVVNFDGKKGSIRSVGQLGAGKSKSFYKADFDPDQNTPEFLLEARKLLLAALVEDGLYKKEALAMINTWNSHYFKTPGLRLLYLMPRALEDKVLPLQVNPAPDELERTLVVRIEIFTQNEEIHLLEFIKNLYATGQTINLESIKTLSLGSLAEAKLQRVREILQQSQKNPELLIPIASLIQELNTPNFFPFSSTFGHGQDF